MKKGESTLSAQPYIGIWQCLMTPPVIRWNPEVEVANIVRQEAERNGYICNVEMKQMKEARIATAITSFYIIIFFVSLSSQDISYTHADYTIRICHLCPWLGVPVVFIESTILGFQTS